MNTQNQETRKIITGLLIGAVGAGALYCMCAASQRKTPVLQKIGRSIANVGEMIEHCDLSSVTNVAESMEKKLPQGADMLNSLSDWVSTGLSLWKKFSK